MPLPKNADPDLIAKARMAELRAFGAKLSASKEDLGKHLMALRAADSPDHELIARFAKLHAAERDLDVWAHHAARNFSETSGVKEPSTAPKEPPEKPGPRKTKGKAK